MIQPRKIRPWWLLGNQPLSISLNLTHFHPNIYLNNHNLSSLIILCEVFLGTLILSANADILKGIYHSTTGMSGEIEITRMFSLSATVNRITN